MKKIYGLVLIGGTILICSCKQKKAEVSEKAITNVRTVHPLTGLMTDTIAASGSITTIEQTDLSFKAGGTVMKVLVKEGDFVEKGQLLAELNTSEYTAQIEQANLKMAQYKRDLGRLKVLVRDTLATLEQLQNTETSLATSQAQKDALIYNFDQARIYAPVDGVILKKQVNVGEFKTSGALTFTLGINDNHQRWVFKVSVSDVDRLKLKMNQPTQVKLDAMPAKTFTGSVNRLETVPDPVTHTYDCYIGFDPQKEPIVYGLTGNIILPSKSDNRYTSLPIQAITGITGGYGIIYTVSDQSVVNRMRIRLLNVSQDKAVLATTLSPDLQVITAGNDVVEQGQKVHIENATL